MPENPTSRTLLHRASPALFLFLRALLAFSPALILGWFVAQYSVNTPVWDDWERGPLIEKFKSGTLTFWDLYAPHIDHRIFFPRILILAFNEISGGDLRWEIAGAFAFGVGAAMGVAKLASLTLGKDIPFWPLIFVSNMIILSPIQWDNWSWGVQIAFLMPMTCTVWSLVACLMPWVWWKRLAMALALAIVGTHSFGHGFAVWPAVLGLVLLLNNFSSNPRDRWKFLGCWVVAAAFIIGCYTQLEFLNSSDSTHAYGQGAGAPPPSVVNRHTPLNHPDEALRFLSTLAGTPFARMHLVDPVQSAPVIGMFLLLAFVILGLVAILKWVKSTSLRDQMLPWLALGGAALLGMAAVTVGRMHFAGYTRAVSIRYVSISLYLTIAILFLAVIVWQHLRQKRREPWSPCLLIGVLGVVAGFMIPAWNHGAQMMRLIGHARYQGQAALMFINHWNPDFMLRIDAGVRFPKIWANYLNQHDLLDPKLVETLDLAQFKPLHRDRPLAQAGVESIEVLGECAFVLSGYARWKDRPADGVLLTKESKGGKPVIFAMAEPNGTMLQQPYPNDLELIGRFRPDRRDFCRWEEEFSVQELGFLDDPDLQEVIVRAWVFDVTRQRSYRIHGAWKVTSSGSAVKVP